MGFILFCKTIGCGPSRGWQKEAGQPNGESPMCDSYEARLMELLHLDPFFAGKSERRPAFTTDEEKPNAIFDQQRLDVGASHGRAYPN